MTNLTHPGKPAVATDPHQVDADSGFALSACGSCQVSGVEQRRTQLASGDALRGAEAGAGRGVPAEARGSGF